MSENVTDDEFDEVGQMDAEDYGELKQAYDALLAERDALREAGDALAEAAENDADPDPCWTDHHGLCQAHSLTDPCTNAELLRTAAAWRVATGRKESHERNNYS